MNLSEALKSASFSYQQCQEDIRAAVMAIQGQQQQQQQQNTTQRMEVIGTASSS